jgi:HSP20 family protein
MMSAPNILHVLWSVRSVLTALRRFAAPLRFERNLKNLDIRIDVVEKDGGKVLRSERYYGSVSRTFTLTQDVDDAKAVAKYENGVLTLDLPKKATSVSKRLTVS